MMGESRSQRNRTPVQQTPTFLTIMSSMLGEGSDEFLKAAASIPGTDVARTLHRLALPCCNYATVINRVGQGD